MKKDKKVNWTATASIKEVKSQNGIDLRGKKWESDELFLEYDDPNLELPYRIRFFRPHYQGYIPKRNDRISFLFSETNGPYPMVDNLEKIGEKEVDPAIEDHFQNLDQIFQGVRDDKQKYESENKEKIKMQKKTNQKAAADLSDNFWKSDKFWKRKKK